jgi:plasmid stabilization system protein ParE
MVDIERKEVKVSALFNADLINVFEYGEETFGYNAAKVFIGEIFNFVWNLDSMYLAHPECRFIPTKSKMYRNIILGTYLIIYRITPKRIEVLRVINSKITVKNIRAARSVKVQ